MLWLIWQMWFLLFLAFGIGLAAGWRIWSGSGGGENRDLQHAQDEIARLRRQNDDLTRSLAVAKKDHDDALSTRDAGNTPAPAPSVSHNDLIVIRGLGPKAVATLREGGVTTFEQIAAWTPKDISIWDAKLTARGRIERDDWVGQAKALIDEE